MKTMMLKAAIAGAVVTGTALAGAAEAATSFTLGSYDVNFNDEDPGLVLNVKELLPEPASATLEVGDHVIVDLFKLWTDESAVNRDDKSKKDISVDFDFSAPEIFAGSVNGETFGVKGGFLGSYQAGKLTWEGPQQFLFGNGGILEVSLFDETFNEGFFFGLTEGKKFGATVEAKFKLIAESQDVPEPALMLGLGSVAAAGFLAGKRSRKEEVA